MSEKEDNLVIILKRKKCPNYFLHRKITKDDLFSRDKKLAKNKLKFGVLGQLSVFLNKN